MGAHPRNRVKRVTANLGELLCVASVCSATWEDLAASVLEEAFDRNVLWALKAHPKLGEAEEKELRSLSFQANAVSLKLLSFQAWFIRKVARPTGQAPQDILKRYNRTKGVPPVALVDALQAHCKALGRMASHSDFFELTGLHSLPPRAIADLLRANRANSAAKRYHNPQQFP